MVKYIGKKIIIYYKTPFLLAKEIEQRQNIKLTVSIIVSYMINCLKAAIISKKLKTRHRKYKIAEEVFAEMSIFI